MGGGGREQICVGEGRGGEGRRGYRSVWVRGPGAVVSEQHEKQDVCLYTPPETLY